MRNLLIRTRFVGVLLGLAAALTIASPAAAECPGLDRWPSFREGARSARRIVVGEVVEGFTEDPTGRFFRFRLRVDEVLRGSSPAAIDFRDAVKSGVPPKICPGDSILRVHRGDVIAFAFDARVAESPGLVLTVAFVHGTPDDFLLPGVERLTLAQVRRLAALPVTATAQMAERSDTPMGLGPLLAISFAGLLLYLRVTRRRA